MVFPVAAIISFLSQFVTLQPGDVIATGTPSGVGSATGTFLRPGDRVRATIGPIGTLENPVESEDRGRPLTRPVPVSRSIDESDDSG